MAMAHSVRPGWVRFMLPVLAISLVCLVSGADSITCYTCNYNGPNTGTDECLQEPWNYTLTASEKECPDSSHCLTTVQTYSST